MARFIVLILSILLIINEDCAIFHDAESFDGYLAKYCHHSRKYELVVTEASSNQSDLVSHLLKMQCNMRLTRMALVEKLVNSRLQGGTLQIVFDWSSAPVDEAQYNSILLFQSGLYAKCSNCVPFISVFNLHERVLFSWSNNSIRHLPTDFRSIQASLAMRPILIRPILDGCHLCPHVFWPRNQVDHQRLKVPPDKCNLNLKTLRISVNNGFPFCMFNKSADGHIEPQYSVEFLLLNIMMRKYNFTSKFVDAHGSWGMVLNGKWTGLIGQVFNGVTDFGICLVGKTSQRQAVVDFTDYTVLDQLGILSHSPSIQKHDVIFSNRISSTVWIVTFASFVLVTNLLFVVSRIYHKRSKHRKRLTTFGSIVVKVCGICLKQSLISISKESIAPKRLLYAGWMLAALILANGYSSEFYSRLTAPEYDKPIDTMEQLAHIATHDTHYITLKDFSSTHSAVINATPEDGIYYLIRKHLERLKREFIHDVNKAIPTLEQDKRMIYLTVKISTMARVQLYGSMRLHFSDERLETIYLGWALGKRSPLTRPFNLIIVRIRETGLYQHWLQSTVRRTALKMGRSIAPVELDMHLVRAGREAKTLTLDELYSVFVTWAIACAVSSGLFISEIMLRLCHTPTRHKL